MSNATPIYKLGHDVVDSNANFETAADKSNFGVVSLRMRSRGKGAASRLVLMGRPTALFEDFVGRTDLPVGTVLFAPDVGQRGSYWRYVSAGVWVPDRPFTLLSLDTPIATPQVITISGSTFQQFTGGLTLPVEFWTMGVRRVAIAADIERTSGTSGTTALTQIILDDGTNPVFSAQWTAGTVLHQPESEFWASAPTTISQRGRLVYSGASPPAAVAASTPSDVTISGLNTTPKTLRIGIHDPSATVAVFKLVNVTVRVIA